MSKQHECSPRDASSACACTGESLGVRAQCGQLHTSVWSTLFPSFLVTMGTMTLLYPACGKAAQPVTCQACAPCYELVGKLQLFQNPISPLDQWLKCARGGGLCQLRQISHHCCSGSLLQAHQACCHHRAPSSAISTSFLLRCGLK